MKINTKHLQTVSAKTDNDLLILLFKLRPEQKTNVCGHYFMVEIDEIPRGVTRCSITIQGTNNTYFPNAWLNWNPVTKNCRKLKSVPHFDSITLEIAVDEDTLSCAVQSYPYLGAEDIAIQLVSFESVCDHSLALFGQPFSFVFGQNPKRLIVSRQHPGESVASSFSAGILKFLQENKPGSAFIIVPVMALRGLKNGEYRTNNNLDLNRSWMTDAPEVQHVRKIIDTYRITEILDVHGDEVSKIDYMRSGQDDGFQMPAGVSKLAQPSRIRKILSRLRNRIKTTSNGCSLRDYCLSKKIRYTLLELSMSEDNSFLHGFEFAQANLKYR